MSENYIVIDGKRIDFTPDQVELIMNSKEHTPSTNRVKGHKYYYVSAKGEVEFYIDQADKVDERLYAVANYYTDEQFAGQVALRETLNKLLLRYSDQHGGRLRMG